MGSSDDGRLLTELAVCVHVCVVAAAAGHARVPACCRYPRNDIGWCNKPTGQAMCGYPYDRNPRSHAYIPHEVGKFIKTSVGGRGKVRKYLTSTFWYLQ